MSALDIEPETIDDIIFAPNSFESSESKKLSKFSKNVLKLIKDDPEGWKEEIPFEIIQPMIYVLSHFEKNYLKKRDFKNAYKFSNLIKGMISHKRLNTYASIKEFRSSYFSMAISEEQKLLRSEMKEEANTYFLEAVTQKKNTVIQAQRLIEINNELAITNIELQASKTELTTTTNELMKLNDSIELKKLELSNINEKLNFWKDTAAVIAQAKIDVEKRNIEINLLKEKERESKENFQLLFALTGLFAMFALLLAWFASIQMKKARLQQIIANSLRLAISQVTHISRNSLTRMKKKVESEIDFSDLGQIQIHVIPAIAALINFINLFESLNKKEVLIQTIQQEVNLGLQIAQADFPEFSESTDMDQFVSEMNSTLKETKVPIYTVMNLIYNSFKFSKKNKPIAIELASNEKRNMMEVSVIDRAEKYELSSISDEGEGIKYIKRMLKHFGTKKNPVTRVLTKDGYHVKMTLKKIK